VRGSRSSPVEVARRVAYVLSTLVAAEAVVLLVPLTVAALYGEMDGVRAFASTIVIAGALGVSGTFLLRTELKNLSRREGLAIVALGWVVVCLIGSLPFEFTGTLGPLNAWFECVSGFSGTGASVIPDVEALPRGILFWRNFSHWIGGMGFVVLYIALYPRLGVGAMQLYRAEVPGPATDRLRPRISSTARILWSIYLLLSAALTVLLLFGGLDLFDSLCQMFSTIGTGGFSTRNDSIAGFGSAYVDWVLIGFMVLAATNFSLHWGVLTGRPGTLFRNPEWRFYIGVLSVVSLVVVLLVWLSGDAAFGDSVREGVFVVVSMGTTTGFALGDYEVWPVLAQLLIFLLLFVGGCAGSTSGSVKCIRVQLFTKQALRGIFNTVHPKAVAPPRLGDKAVTGQMMRAVFAFVGLYGMTWAAAAAAISLTDMDFTTAIAASASCLGNVGPGLGDVGPFDTFAWVHPAGKAILSFCMLAGRLELFTLLVLFSPVYWRR